MISLMVIAVGALLVLEVVLLRTVRARRRSPPLDSAGLAETGRRTALLALFVMLLAAVILIVLLRFLAQSPAPG